MILLLLAVAALLAASVTWTWCVLHRRGTLRQARERAEKLIQEGRADADQIRKDAYLEGQEELAAERTRLQEQTEARNREGKARKQALADREQALTKRLEFLEAKETDLEARCRSLEHREETTAQKEKDLARSLDRQMSTLERVAGLTREQARAELLQRMTEEARQRGEAIVRETVGRAEAEAERRSQMILSQALSRVAIREVMERTTSVIRLPDDDMKGRIIGREGRNIRCIEMATGVDLIVDDVPKTITLSCFNPLRRAIAKTAIEQLVEDGRIHPARIEEVVERVEKEFAARIQETGEAAALELDVHGLHHRVLQALGAMRYQLEWGQDLLRHSCEVAMLAGMMAGELAMDVDLVRRAGLLHDIGKSCHQTSLAGVVEAGVELLSRFGESREIIRLVGTQGQGNGGVPPEVILIQAADQISMNRPGARSSIHNNFFQRMSRLEEMMTDLEGVAKVYALRAGKEVRVIVESDLVDDQAAFTLAREIRRRVEGAAEHFGQVGINVIRETRAVNYAL